MFLGALKAGAVFTPINYRLSPREIALHLEDSRPAVFAYDSLLTPVVR
jgi:acyl-CoA synthetase (AMP-forming)/AMP-acid ligase II